MVEQMWAVHLKHDSDVEKEVQRWKGTADGILIFVSNDYLTRSVGDFT